MLANQANAIRQEVESFTEERILNTSLDGLRNYFDTKYTIEVLEIDDEGISVDHDETRIDVSRDFRYAPPIHPGGSRQVTGTQYQVTVPFSGDAELFKWQASAHSLGGLHAAVRDGFLIFAYDRLPSDSSDLRSDIDRDLARLQQHLDWTATDVQSFNSSVREIAQNAIEARRATLMQTQTTAQELGFPVRRRAGAPNTYAHPEIRRKIAPKLPPMDSPQSAPEPALNAENYENILSILSSIGTSMERSPRAFGTIGEEVPRFHFLVHLNDQYESQATGETFNGEGKTDILVRAGGKNIFIAECKFWRGPAAFNDGLNQLLSYTTGATPRLHCWYSTAIHKCQRCFVEFLKSF